MVAKRLKILLLLVGSAGFSFLIILKFTKPQRLSDRSETLAPGIRSWLVGEWVINEKQSKETEDVVVAIKQNSIEFKKLGKTTTLPRLLEGKFQMSNQIEFGGPYLAQNFRTEIIVGETIYYYNLIVFSKDRITLELDPLNYKNVILSMPVLHLSRVPSH